MEWYFIEAFKGATLSHDIAHLMGLIQLLLIIVAQGLGPSAELKPPEKKN
jgi:hypothetical protein